MKLRNFFIWRKYRSKLSDKVHYKTTANRKDLDLQSENFKDKSNWQILHNKPMIQLTSTRCFNIFAVPEKIRIISPSKCHQCVYLYVLKTTWKITAFRDQCLL